MTGDPKDDYLVAVARAHTVDAIISGDPGLEMVGGPPTLAPRKVLDALVLEGHDLNVLVTALWDLQLRIQPAETESSAPHVAAGLEHIHAAVRALDGDPQLPRFGVEDLADSPVDIRTLNWAERTACAYALELNRQLTGSVQKKHVIGSTRLPFAFEILDRQAALERLLEQRRQKRRRQPAHSVVACACFRCERPDMRARCAS